MNIYNQRVACVAGAVLSDCCDSRCRHFGYWAVYDLSSLERSPCLTGMATHFHNGGLGCFLLFASRDLPLLDQRLLQHSLGRNEVGWASYPGARKPSLACTSAQSLAPASAQKQGTGAWKVRRGARPRLTAWSCSVVGPAEKVMIIAMKG
jgi:hypothetical protein